MLTSSYSEKEASIIVKINNEIITSYDLETEKKYLAALSPNIKNLTQEQQYNIAKESIIREKIKHNEILKYTTLGKETDYLNKLIVDNYKKLGLKNEIEFKKHLSKYDLTIDDVKKKI